MQNVIADVYVSIFLSNSTNTASVPEQMFCPLLNASVCRPSESLSMVTTLIPQCVFLHGKNTQYQKVYVIYHNIRSLLCKWFIHIIYSSLQFSVVVYNSLAQPRTSWIRIPVVNNNNRFVVKDANGGSVASEVRISFSSSNTTFGII